MKRYTAIAFTFIAIAVFGGCSSPSRQNSTPMQALSLKISSPVKAKVPYPAVFVCTMPSVGVDNIKGHFFWNQEGPFEYPLQKYDMVETPQNGRQPQLTFYLYTGRPDTYTISGYIYYRNTVTGMMGKTEKISAGPVTVK